MAQLHHAVGSHYGFKDGKPLVGRSAVMGARADFRMIGLALMGRLDDEFRNTGSPTKRTATDDGSGPELDDRDLLPGCRR
jgi:hypothetical protein